MSKSRKDQGAHATKKMKLAVSLVLFAGLLFSFGFALLLTHGAAKADKLTSVFAHPSAQMVSFIMLGVGGVALAAGYLVAALAGEEPSTDDQGEAKDSES